MEWPNAGVALHKPLLSVELFTSLVNDDDLMNSSENADVGFID